MLRRLVLERPTYLIFVLVTLFFVAFAPNFASLSTAGAILRVTALVTIMAVGMTFVIICAEIDLSVGSLASWSGMVAALLLDRNVPTSVAPLLVLAMGAGIGAVTGASGHQGADPVLPGDARHAQHFLRSRADR